MSEKPRIGIYICHCGLNIAGTVDVEELARYAASLPDVIVARDYVFMCSEPGQNLIKEDIKEKELNRIVIAACSPSMHEQTFRSVLESAGLNKYLLEMANIREHCSWIHSDRRKATEKAKEIVRMAASKARYLEPIEEKTFPTTRNVMILGGGVAGMRAAIELAEYGFEVYLVERKPILGGKSAVIGYISPGIRGKEIVQKMFERIRGNPRIHVFTQAELIELKGFAGNFTGKLRIHPKHVNERCNECGECEDSCPIEISNEYDFSLSRRKAIYKPFPGSYPEGYIIDDRVCVKCGECVRACRRKAIDLDGEEKLIEIKFGALIIAVGYDPYRPSKGEFGYGLSDSVLTLFQLERLLDEDGPTKGEPIVRGKIPETIAFVQCVGSRSTTPSSRPYCSRMCCTSALTNAIRLKEKHPEIEIFFIYRDIMTYGSDEGLYEEAGKRMIKFIKYEGEPPQVQITPEGVFIEVTDYLLQESIRIPVDAVILSTGMIPPRDLGDVIAVTRATCGEEGFLREAHIKLAPVESPTRGIYIAGSVSGPKNIRESIISGSAAAAKAMALISRGEVVAEPMIAKVDEERCSGCGICISACPYNAISIEEKEGDRLARVEDALCMGCGTCASACPSGAMQQLGFKDIQIRAQISALSEVEGK
ncbi:MAG: CoB--CoM heterodisulfide reductase iron-sulfur subunit A family protein [Fervidicoccaceae archaeon]